MFGKSKSILTSAICIRHDCLNCRRLVSEISFHKSFTAATETNLPQCIPKKTSLETEILPPKINQNVSRYCRPLIFLGTLNNAKASESTMLVRLPQADVIVNAKRKRQKKPISASSFCNSMLEDEIIRHFSHDQPSLSESNSIYCVYNPGVSMWPNRLIDANAKKLIILEPSQSPHHTKWQKFAGRFPERVWIENYNLNRLSSNRIRDFHAKSGVDTLCRAFKTAGAKSMNDSGDRLADSDGKLWSSDEEPPIRLVGVADLYNEYSLFAGLLRARISRTSLFEFGSVEVVAGVSSQQYLDLHPVVRDCIFENDANVCKRVPKFVRNRASHFHYVFDVKCLGKEPLSRLIPTVKERNRLKYELSKTGSIYDDLGIDKHSLYWVAIRPRICDDIEGLISEDFGESGDEALDSSDTHRRRQFKHLCGLIYLSKRLSLYRKSMKLSDLLGTYFPRCRVETADESVTLAELKFTDLISMYKSLARVGGAPFYTSPFFAEAQEYQDNILYPAGIDKDNIV